MSGIELHELLAASRELISDTWNYFLTVHLAVLGIIFISRGHIGVLNRLVLIGAYAAFMYMNYRAQLDNYQVQVAILEQINLLSGPDAAVAKAIAPSNETWVVEYLEYLYGAAGFASSAVIMFFRRDE